MSVENPKPIGTKTIVYDSWNDYALFVLGGRAQTIEADHRFHTRVDDSWWLIDFYGDPVRDEWGNLRMVARFEIGDDCRYCLDYPLSYWRDYEE